MRPARIAITRDHIADYWDAGLSVDEIAVATKAHPAQIRALARNLGLLASGGGRAPGERALVRLGVTLTAALRPHATARGISVSALCERLLETIAQDDLVKSILDDEVAA